MEYMPVVGDKIRLTHSTRRGFIFRVDQVILTDEGQILGVVISVHVGPKRYHHLYDMVTFEGFKPVRVGHGGQAEPASET